VRCAVGRQDRRRSRRRFAVPPGRRPSPRRLAQGELLGGSKGTTAAAFW
jgi:hypothetical protein